jgi:catechol-2,3-dioxygenase
MNITSLGRASIKVRDLDASERFYSSVLRMTTTGQLDRNDEIGFRVGRSDQLVLQASGRAATHEDGGIQKQHIAFVVGNNPRMLEEAATHLTAHGVAFEQVTHEEYESLYLHDPDGHLVELYYWPEW